MRLRLEFPLALTSFYLSEVEMADYDNRNIEERTLLGRRQIFTTFEDINAENIVDVVNEALSTHFLNLDEMEYLYWFRRGLQPILARTKEVRPEINHKVVENHADEIVAFKNGYFLTKPAFYVSRADDTKENDKVKELNEFLYRSGKQEADNSIVDWFHTVGKGILYVTPNDDEDVPFLAYALDPRKAFVAYDLRPGNAPVFAVNMVVQDTVVKIDCYTKENVYRLSGAMVGRYITGDPVLTATAINLDKVETNVLGEIPIIEYQYNAVWMGAFESVIPLLNAINSAQSDRLDGVSQFIQSLAIAVNCDLDDGVTANDIRQAGMIVLKSLGENKADFRILSEQLNQSETQVLVDYLYDQVLTICGMPVSSKSRFGSADTQSAQLAKDGWYQADAVVRNTEDLFIKANRQFDRIMLKILKKKNLLSLKESEIKLQFPRNETANVQSKAQAMHTLLSAGLAPELAFAKSGISNDPVNDVALSKKYLNLVWGDPDVPLEKSVEGAIMAGQGNGTTPPPPQGTGGKAQNTNNVNNPASVDTEGQNRNQGVHWVNGYWKS